MRVRVIEDFIHPPPQGSNDKILSYQETRTGIPGIIQIWMDLAETSAWFLVLIPVCALGLLHPFLASMASWCILVTVVLKGLPKYNPFQHLGFKLFSWVIAQ